MAIVSELLVNGSKKRVEADSKRSLLCILRHDLDMTGAKYGCGEGRCGACTVLIDGQPTRSCTTEVGKVEGKQIQTIEGLETDGRLHPVQEAFLACDAMQCGFCTTGMIMSAVALLRDNPTPSTEEASRFMNGNICRCGTYSRILAAIHKAGAAMKGGQK